MRFSVLASGSTGNAVYVENDEYSFLVDVNDYFGKGLSGGKVVAIAPIKGEQETNVIAGNVCLHGAKRIVMKVD